MYSALTFPSFQPYYLPSLDATVDQRSLPLGYAWKGLEPDPLLACDAVDCREDDGHVNLPVQHLNCGHTSHKVCLGKSSHRNDHGYSMPSRAICTICSVQLPLRVQELASSFNKGLLAGNDDNEQGEQASDDDDADDNDGDNNDDDSEDSAYDSHDKPVVTMVQKILLKAKECLQHLPQADLFKYSNKYSKPATSEVTLINVNTGHVCLKCGRVCKTKGGLTQHQTTHK